jgi:EpsI family protein
LAYLTQKSWKRVFVVLIAGVVVTVLANGIRVALAGVMGQEYGANMLHGPGHIFRGWFVAQLGWILIFFVNWLVGRFPHPQTLHLYERWKGKVQYIKEEGTEAGKTTKIISPAVVILSILFCFAIYLNFFAQPAAVTLPEGFSGIPEKIGRWQGKDVAWLPGNVYFPGADPTFLRRYQTASGKEVYVYIGYFAEQKNNARLVSYHSRSLLAGKKIITCMTDEGRMMRIRVTHTMIGSVRYRILSWYQNSEYALINKYKVKIQGIRDALLHHRNNGAVILLATPVLNGEEDRDRADDDLVAFAKHIAPIVRGVVSVASP